jgi:hypothetical protein
MAARLLRLPTILYPALVVALATTYFVTAKASLLLAIPPGYATAVWPPSGIALAALLLYGTRLWPGVWLGAALANFTIDHSVGLTCVIATGNTLEVVCAAWLAQRLMDDARGVSSGRLGVPLCSRRGDRRRDSRKHGTAGAVRYRRSGGAGRADELVHVVARRRDRDHPVDALSAGVAASPTCAETQPRCRDCALCRALRDRLRCHLRCGVASASGHLACPRLPAGSVHGLGRLPLRWACGHCDDPDRGCRRDRGHPCAPQPVPCFSPGLEKQLFFFISFCYFFFFCFFFGNFFYFFFFFALRFFSFFFFSSFFYFFYANFFFFCLLCFVFFFFFLFIFFLFFFFFFFFFYFAFFFFSAVFFV